MESLICLRTRIQFAPHVAAFAHPTESLSEKAKHNMLGGTAARLFKLPPRNEKQKENLIKFGNYTAA